MKTYLTIIKQKTRRFCLYSKYNKLINNYHSLNKTTKNSWKPLFIF